MKHVVWLCVTCCLCGSALARGVHSAPDEVNAVIGNESYEAWMGEAPSADVDEQVRIMIHLAYVEQKLRARSSEHLSPALRAARSRNLDRLRTYWMRGQFPYNDGHPDTRRPTFIDETGAVCAVGALIERDLGRAAIQSIATREKYDYIDEITEPALGLWQRTSGLTFEELAMIQPTYRPPFSKQHQALHAKQVEYRLRDAFAACFRAHDPARRLDGQKWSMMLSAKDGVVVSVDQFQIEGETSALQSCIKNTVASNQEKTRMRMYDFGLMRPEFDPCYQKGLCYSDVPMFYDYYRKSEFAVDYGSPRTVALSKLQINLFIDQVVEKFLGRSEVFCFSCVMSR